MTLEYTEIRGQEVEAGALRLPKAQALARLLSATPTYPFVELVACRAIAPLEPATGSYLEAVLFDVHVEVPQSPIHDIRHVERIAAIFLENDQQPPDAVALRMDFPTDVSHLNIRLWERPPSLCLSDRPYDEDKLRWTARRFVERIRTWLALTAEGQLHQEDQPLEPLLMGVEASVILPHDLFTQSGETVERLECYRTDGHESENTIVILARRPGQSRKQEGNSFVAVPLGITQTVTHGVIRWQPQTLKALHDFVSPAGLNILAELRERMRQWCADAELMRLIPIFLVAVPKRRHDQTETEAVDTWAFLADKTLGEIGQEVGALAKLEATYAPLIGAINQAAQGENVHLGLMRPYFQFNRERAQQSNGLVTPKQPVITAVGMGALGSQVFNHLVRAGFGRWWTVDDDNLLPHNLARHELNRSAIGYPKALPLAGWANDLLNEADAATAVVTNILHPQENAERLGIALQEADVLLDMSASVSVARHLSRDLDHITARRISAFLTPTGKDLVLLAEDTGRALRLDALEMQYYRAVATLPELAGHLYPGEGRQRYGRACRDLSQILPQDLMALHSATAARAVRRTVQETEGSLIRVWRADDEFGVTVITVPTYAAVEMTTSIANWKLCTDVWLLNKVQALRKERLPQETGGVLIGSVDTQRQIVYVVDVLPSPPDSKESRTGYVRGAEGLQAEVERVGDATAGWLEYIGEWHSHPAGCPAAPSQEDRVLFTWLDEHMAVEDHPPIMLIVGEEQRWYVEALPAVS